jgi:hypothetical protein
MPSTDIFEIKFTVKEDHSDNTFLEIEWMKQTQGESKNSIGDKILFLKFAKKTTIHQAQEIAREMNHRFSELSVLSHA